MARFLLYTDLHLSTSSSIIPNKENIDDLYSCRLKHTLDTLNYINELKDKYKLSEVICLGDFFDRPDLTSEELSLISEWKCKNHTFLVGNHDALNKDLSINALNLFKLSGNKVITKPSIVDYSNVYLVFLPYIADKGKLKLSDYIDIPKDKPAIILSHNDIYGLNYGGFVSQSGFDIEDIKQNCILFLNGHLHNCSVIYEDDNTKIVNLGNILGQNFNEDAFKYAHQFYYLDTDNLKFGVLEENPFSFNFYKLIINSGLDENKLLDIKSNAVLSIKVNPDLHERVEQLVKLNKKILAYRIIDEYKENVKQTDVLNIKTFDYLSEFRQEALKKLYDNGFKKDLINNELSKICK